jgi:hypothetical protein
MRGMLAPRMYQGCGENRVLEFWPVCNVFEGFSCCDSELRVVRGEYHEIRFRKVHPIGGRDEAVRSGLTGSEARWCCQLTCKTLNAMIRFRKA